VIVRKGNERLGHVENMMAILAHDLRSPLMAVTMTAEALAAREGLVDSDTRLVARILRAVARMDRMIEHLSDFAETLRADGIPVHRAWVDLEALLRAQIDELEAGHLGARCQLDARGDPTGYWDGDRLCEAFSNLLTNANEHGSGRDIAITMRGRSKDVEVRVDNAGAIANHLLPTLFEPFHEGRGGSHHMGLGLFIAHQVVCRHGGTLDIACLDDHTSVTIVLPRLPPRT
jgi:signal transduction histidine kinase